MMTRVAQHLSLILVAGALTTISNTASAQDLDLDEQEVAKKKRSKKARLSNLTAMSEKLNGDYTAKRMSVRQSMC